MYYTNSFLFIELSLFVCLMVLNATFNNISAISWRSVLLVEETWRTRRKPMTCGKLYHIMWYTSPWSRFKHTTSVVIGTDCIGSCKFNYHTIMATTAPCFFRCKVSTHTILQNMLVSGWMQSIVTLRTLKRNSQGMHCLLL